MIDVTGSVYLVKKQRDGFSKIREGGDDGFVKQMKQNTCKHLEKADGTTSATWSNKFDFLKITESELKCKRSWRSLSTQEPPRAYGEFDNEKSVTRTVPAKMVRLATASGSPIHAEGDATL